MGALRSLLERLVGRADKRMPLEKRAGEGLVDPALNQPADPDAAGLAGEFVDTPQNQPGDGEPARLPEG